MEQKEDAEGAVRLSEDRFRSLIQNSSDVTIIIDDQGVFRYLSPAVEELLGYRPAALVGPPATDYVHPDDEEYLRLRLGPEFHTSSETAVLEFRMRRRDGTGRHVEAVDLQPARPAVGGRLRHQRPRHHRARRSSRTAPAHRALHDPLTGPRQPPAHPRPGRPDARPVPARAASRWPPSSSTSTTSRMPTTPSGTKRATGSSRRSPAGWSGCCGRATRWGAWAATSSSCWPKGSRSSAGPEAIAERIRQVLRPAFYVEGFESLPLCGSASIGIAVGDRPSAQDLLRDADIALYRAKGAGRDRAVVFEEAMQLAANDRLGPADRARRRPARRPVHPPLPTHRRPHRPPYRRRRGADPLEPPSQGTVTPDRFIPMLEDSGQIVDVGRWVLNEACAQLARWRTGGPSAVHVGQRLDAPARVRRLRRRRPEPHWSSNGWTLPSCSSRSPRPC